MLELIWTTKIGVRIPVSKMGTRHIVNCIRMIERSGFSWRSEYYARLQLELELRGLK